MNYMGILGLFTPNRVKVPQVTVERLAGKRSLKNKLLLRKDKPSEMTHVQVCNNNEVTMIYCGRDKKQVEQPVNKDHPEPQI